MGKIIVGTHWLSYVMVKFEMALLDGPEGIKDENDLGLIFF